MEFVKRLRERRKELGVTRNALALSVGVSPETIKNIESMLQCPNDDVSTRISVALECPELMRIDRSEFNEFVTKRRKVWYSENKKKVSDIARKRRSSQKKIVIDHYGGRCVCCGESTFEFLTIDHINNDGNEQRKLIGKSSFYVWVIKNGFPSDLQILCRNCNWGKHANGGICPHVV